MFKVSVCGGVFIENVYRECFRGLFLKECLGSVYRECLWASVWRFEGSAYREHF